MHHLEDPLFRILFDQLAEPRLIVKADDPFFTIVAINPSWQPFASSGLYSLSGRKFAEAGSLLVRDTQLRELILESLAETSRRKETLQLDPYEVTEGPGLTTSGWLRPVCMPIRQAPDGQVTYLICTLYDITEEMTGKQQLQVSQQNEAELLREQQTLNEELAATNEELSAINEELMQSQESLWLINQELEERVEARTRELEESAYQLNRMVMSTPIGLTILRERELIIETANQPMLDILGLTYEQATGKRLPDIFRGLTDQPVTVLPETIFDTGEPLTIAELPIMIKSAEGQKERTFVNIFYNPLFNRHGKVEGILLSVTDVTELSAGRRQLQERQEELEALNEEFTAANEELAATNETLSMTQESLRRLFDHLAESEIRFRSLFEQAPIGMCFLKGEGLIIELANDEILKIWGRGREEVLGLPHELARPELKGQRIGEWLRQAYYTGTTWTNNELQVFLHHNGGLREAYVNSVYHPLKDSSDRVTGLMIMLNDITAWVTTRKQAERAQQQLQMAVESAQLGTWHLNLRTRKLTASARLKELFGFYPEDEMSFEDAIGQIAEDYREIVIASIEAAIEKEDYLELEYPLSRYHDGKLQWVRATGKVFPAQSGGPAYFSGTVLDITERKLEEMRKNDFIAIASHELKTPLTSLKALLQILSAKAGNIISADFLKETLGKSLVQVAKMNMLIAGFLDMAKLESGMLHLDLESFELNRLLQDTADEALQVSKTHQIRFLPGEPVWLFADRNKIAQVVNNFLSNAIKYSPRGKYIELSCRVEGQEVIISVTDEGMGIKQQELDKLFNRFYRVESKHTKTISGFGIGLYLCAEIVRLHNGRIWAKSETGKGSAFYFSLPLPDRI